MCVNFHETRNSTSKKAHWAGATPLYSGKDNFTTESRGDYSTQSFPVEASWHYALLPCVISNVGGGGGLDTKSCPTLVAP